MPYISQVAVGKLEKLHVFGNDYNTVDGTGVRDYIHVVDLAAGHVKAVEWVLKNEGCEAINLGTGNGTSVLQLKDAFVKASGVDVPFVIDPRRPGDPDEVYANAKKAKDLLTKTTTVVTNAVRAVFQTYVDSLKQSGEVGKEAQIETLNQTKNIALTQLSEDVKEYIKSKFGDINTWLKTQIEATINLIKN